VVCLLADPWWFLLGFIVGICFRVALRLLLAVRVVLSCAVCLPASLACPVCQLLVVVVFSQASLGIVVACLPNPHGPTLHVLGVLACLRYLWQCCGHMVVVRVGLHPLGCDTRGNAVNISR